MKTRGESFPELIITISIFALSFVILGAVFLAQGRYLAVVNATSDTQYNAFQVLDTVGLYASSASDVVSSMTINGRSYTSGTNTLILAMPAVDANGAIVQGQTDYVAFGLYQSYPSKFMFDLAAATGSARKSGQYVKAALVEKLIFRYNNVTRTAATAIDLYVRTKEQARDRTIRMPLGKIYYLGST